MQSNAARALVAIGSIAVVVVLFIVLSGGDDDSGSEQAADASTATTVESATTNTDEAPEKEQEPKPEIDRIVVVGGEPKGGVRDLTYTKGDRVRLEVSSDVDEHVHVHGYDLFEDVPAGGTAKFSFRVDIDGVFEVELEDSSVQLAQLTVKP